MYAVLSRHCPGCQLPDINTVATTLQSSRHGNCSAVIVPQFPDGGAYRKLVCDIHAELANAELQIENISDDMFHPGEAVGARFTANEYSWRHQSVLQSSFTSGVTSLGVFAAAMYLVELCTWPQGPDTLSHPMWSTTVSNQGAVRYGSMTMVYFRSVSIEQGARRKFGNLVISQEQCRTALSPFYLCDYRG